VEEGVEHHARTRARKDQEQWRPTGLETQLQRQLRQQVFYSALVSSRWSFLAPEDCATLTSTTTGITHRRQAGSFEPGLGISVGDIKPVHIYLVCFVIWLIWFIWLVSFNQSNKPNQLNKRDRSIHVNRVFHA
jgi:hypothetical protein